MLASSPPIAPSTVFPGLTDGMSLCRPIARPTANAPMSDAHVTNTGSSSSSPPDGTRERPRAERQRRAARTRIRDSESRSRSSACRRCTRRRTASTPTAPSGLPSTPRAQIVAPASSEHDERRERRGPTRRPDRRCRDSARGRASGISPAMTMPTLSSGVQPGRARDAEELPRADGGGDGEERRRAALLRRSEWRSRSERR